MSKEVPLHSLYGTAIPQMVLAHTSKVIKLNDYTEGYATTNSITLLTYLSRCRTNKFHLPIPHAKALEGCFKYHIPETKDKKKRHY